MSYFDRELLLDGFVNKEVSSIKKALSSVDKAGICDHLKVLGGEILMAEFLILMQVGMGNLLTHEGLSDE